MEYFTRQLLYDLLHSVSVYKLTFDLEVDDEIPEVGDAVAALRGLALVATVVVERHVLDDQTPSTARNTLLVLSQCGRYPHIWSKLPRL